MCLDEHFLKHVHEMMFNNSLQCIKGFQGLYYSEYGRFCPMSL